MRHTSGFVPQNTLGATETPNFQHTSLDNNSKRSPVPRLGWVDLTGDSDSPANRFQRLSPLSEIGDSSSLFSHTSLSFAFGGDRSGAKATKSPIPFVFGASKPSSQHNNMVNEVAPAKPQGSRPNPAQAAIPQFGRPTLPQSPLHRAPPKESNMFILPKSRPEHHRDIDSSKGVPLYPTTTKQTLNPLIARAPSAYHAPILAPQPSSSFYATTMAAPQPSFSSFSGSSGGFSSVNGSNYVDLTMNNYRPREDDYDPFAFVDPKKAQDDLKALFEGVMEDDDDMPRTRSRKKKKASEAADTLADKLRVLDMESKEEFDVTSDDEDDGTVEGIKVKLLPHQVEGLDWLKARELGISTKKKGKAPKGGILADDMGLGKTLQSISLILANPKPTDQDAMEKRKLPSGVEKCTLVVAPLALIRQWEAEIKDKVESSHSLRVVVHHGPQRTKRFSDLKKYDVIITTYQILVSEFGNSSEDEKGIKVGCFGLHWYRVILDEAHTIKNRNAKASLACCALRSEYRWCLTGTPMQNNLDELQSLIKFLRIPPYNDLREFKDSIDRPMKNGRGDLALKRLRTILPTFMLRRTKAILLKDGALNPGGKPSAPGAANTTGFKVTERKIVNIAAEFSEKERRFYTRLEKRTGASIEQMMSGENVNYASALVMLLRLRQACNHPKLVGGKLGKDSDALAAETGASQKAKIASQEVDEMADMFGNLGVGSKKCEVCQLELGRQAVEDGAIRCLDCEADLDGIANEHKSRKDKKKKKHKHDGKRSEVSSVPRKQRNRAVITDSDDEEVDYDAIRAQFKPQKQRNRAIVTDSDDEEEDREGSWVVPEADQGSLTLGKAGGVADENAEGGGEWLDSDDDTFPDIKDLGTAKQPTKLGNSDEDSDDAHSDQDSASETESDPASESDEVEDEFGSSEEVELATIATSTKITQLIKILGKEIEEHKFIVFSQFTSMLDLIEPFLHQKGFKFTRYDGKMRNDLREASLNKLRNDKSCRILLCSLKCGSLGLNLTAATRVVILEPFWNPFVEEQAIDRVHRLTQKIDVIVYKITVANSVEERILDLQEKKRELAKQTIEGGKGGVGKLGMKEILSLFKRDAEHSHPVSANAPNLHERPRILKEMGPSGSNAEPSDAQERKMIPPYKSGTTKEDSVYGRRW
ncbi:SNF2 family N-terminal domain-containing protein [Amylocarpus encephaloides]|uniref:SNF2 family N-terminal domain-containing protein n=1 Tax=Amylocarpus encephaloides TaxID=45428 RepID=A0A9P7YF50_9HELO|nr:SNF2 family N-terminal domain-containing protein [Amylocarpus encephaloides]